MTLAALNRVLLVEDDLDIQSVAQLALEAVGGFVVEICSSGSEALDTAPKFCPDLVILDVMMPGMNGPSTLRALRELPDMVETPVIFMTAKAQRHEVEHYLELGALGVITKPFDPMTLPATITSIWSQHYAA